MNTSYPEKKLIGLEVVRFISALAILVWHYQHFAFVGYSAVDFERDKQPFFSIFKFFYQYGGMGVQLFWCISGFIFLWKYQDLIHRKIISGKKFFIFRFSRLYPLHIATLLLMAALQFIYFKWHGSFFIDRNNNIAHFIPQLFLASNWGGQGFSFNTPIWSVSVEVLVYFFFFLILRFIGASAWITVLIIVICSAIKINNLTESFIVDCLLYFYIGGLTAQTFKKAAGGKYQNILLALSLLIILAPFAFLTEDLFLKIKPIFLLLYAPALVYIAAIELKLPQSFERLIEVFGNMTYSSYLIHFPLQLFIILIFGLIGIKIPFYSPLFFIGFIVLVLTLAFFVYQYYEKPMQDYIRYGGKLRNTRS
ncbi:peptidoglycan/LPS O-acetylase OafA/YrhL [Polynucleobacter sphagniphilus]|uniref:acyltransferase family protein n=1 Tax=Polynucleobacter sphagniphilus TaxID=1743169 RepID=UPI002404E67F|nr:acyltransferase [Polynucleobacter sphagniphilus]MDF9788656.1 peptidoglycan/LPS O-acetylase OafA/YrhL [Polynucleobacter sphagniphilus]MDH6241823.1 peptidoglycan/LPS O-acetylase OafA/YrhL [Polynucleobacter sphagniphilus]MDH6249160.1 peptidoglycan/LPS O-acetylase OafA/YrhL [Polynucleobacter sphagniphilus]MDH6302704.1 peptidoglycan/LPS O-acetylase OafA/YrhL [Polynucleobacter sphagniphilus]MDH6524336.1 peptidoglycan/LPS O-acetylase OafA/YrhL [Polynucleobacter sphagniphilus]